MAKGGQSDQMKSLKKSNDSLKKQLENARKDIKRLEERVEVQEHASKEHNGGPSREVQLETERSLSWLHESESDIQSELRATVNGLMILKKVSGNWKELLKSSRIIVTLSI